MIYKWWYNKMSLWFQLLIDYCYDKYVKIICLPWDIVIIFPKHINFCSLRSLYNRFMTARISVAALSQKTLVLLVFCKNFLRLTHEVCYFCQPRNADHKHKNGNALQLTKQKSHTSASKAASMKMFFDCSCFWIKCLFLNIQDDSWDFAGEYEDQCLD